MTLVIPNGFAQCALKFSLVGDPEVMVSTIGVDFAAMAGDDQANSDSVANAFQTAWPVAALVVGWTFNGVTSRVGVSGGGVLTVESPRTHTGTTVAETPPQNCCLLVRKRTALAGRRGSGRMYLPPFMITEAAVSKAGVIGTTDLTNMQNAVNTWFNSGQPFHLLHDNLPTVLDPTPITAFAVDRTIATQRRRLRR